MELKDLVAMDKAALDKADFQNETDSGVQLSTNTTAQIAAADVMTDSNGSVEKFRQIKEDLLSPESRQAFILDQENKRRNIISDMQVGVADTLANPQVSVDEKRYQVGAIKTAPLNYKPSTNDKLAEAALTTPEPTDTEQTHQSKMKLLDIVQGVNAQKREAMAAINAANIGTDAGAAKKLKDMGELMVPFAELLYQRKLAAKMGVDRTAWLGELKKKMFDLEKTIPVDKRAEFTHNVIQLIKENPDVVFSDGNDLEALDTLNKMLVDNDYTNFGRWFDNVTVVLDAVGVGAALKWVKGAALGKKAMKSMEVADEAAKAARVRTKVAPTSPSQIIKDTNPEKARAIHKMVADDTTEEAARALYGSDRAEAMAKDLLPEPAIDPKKVENKVQLDKGPQFEEPAPIKSARNRDTNLNTYLSDTELTKVQDKLIDGLENTEGMVPHKESLTITTNEDGSSTFTMMFHPQDSGFSTAEEALNNATYAFRNFGVTEDDFTLYARQGNKWVETTPKELNAKKALRDEYVRRKKRIPDELKTIDYAVGMKYTYSFHPEDLQIDQVLSVKRNLFDRIAPSFWVKSGQGSVQSHFLDAASVLHPQIVEPASVAIDKSVAFKKLFVDQFEEFTNVYKKLPKDRRAMMTDYINEANFKGLRFDVNDLRARGFNKTEIGALKKWRESNDAMWYAANQDMVVTLRSRGYKAFVDNRNDTRLIVKPLKRQAVSERTHVYDPGADSITNLKKADLDKFYEDGGTFARLSEPMKVNGEWVDMVKVENTASTNFLRALRDEEKVLAYRDGYYPVMYDANFFVQKKIRLRNGEEVTKTVASSKLQNDAVRARDQLAASDPDSEFLIVKDRRADVQQGSVFDQHSWDIGTSSGVSYQRFRGKRLKDAGVNLEKAGMSNLVDPLEAVGHQIQKLSERTSMRKYLETAKRRWVQQYADSLEPVTDRYGAKSFPGSIGDIKGKVGASNKTVADARTLFNYINYLENGYINGIDSGFKALMQMAADEIVGNSKLQKLVEGFLRSASKGKPTTEAKAAVFKLFLAGSPQRQLIIQAHQNIQLFAINPKYLVGPIQKDLYRIRKAMLGDKSDAEAIQMWQELQNSGMMEAVDTNNLVRKSALHLADLTVAQKVKSAVSAPVDLAQKIGFDTAEQSVLVLSWLTHRDLALKQGLKLDRRVLDDIAGKARAYTYNMNKAGDMPYNQNSLNVIAQFLQVPHKAMVQPLFNRSLTRVQRARLLAFNTIMYGVPPGLMTFLYQEMKPSQTRDVLEYGLEDVVLNSVLSAVSGEKQQIDFGDSLAPTNTLGTWQFMASVMTLDVGGLVANAPATSLFFGANPRLTNSFKTMARYFHLVDDYHDPELDTKFSDVVTEAAKMFSGYSNAWKAKYAYKTGQKISSLGNLTDEDVTKVEAAMQFFGFQTKTESGSRKVKEKVYGGYGSFNESDVSKWYTDLKRHLANRGELIKDGDISQRVFSEAWRVFGDDEVKARNSLRNLIQRDIERGDTSIFELIQKQIGVKTNAEVRDMINMLPESKRREQLNQMLDRVEERTK